jgi:hypothetical protein
MREDVPQLPNAEERAALTGIPAAPPAVVA